MPEWLKFLKKIFQERPYLVTLGLLGGLLMVVGVLSVVVISSRTGADELVIQKLSETDELGGKLMADVAGAVMKPGVYELETGARVNDALIAAGGLGGEADRDWVERNLNLAAKVTDGQKIYIPLREETEKVAPLQGKGTTLRDKININMASVAELDTLWGVGPATAEKIISGRPYSNIEDLLTKKIIKSNVYETIKDKISLY